MPITNTLETARRLEGLGSSHQLAQGLAEVIETASGDSRSGLVIRADLDSLGKSVRSDLDALRSEMKTEMKDLELRIAERLRSQMAWFFAVQAAPFLPPSR